MPGIARKGLDAAGGVQLAGGQGSVHANGARVVVLGDPVAGHGEPPHAAPVMAQASASVFAGGKPVCRAGDAASCGHATSGSAD
ncbi:MAG TPA: PAAR domain-containing protein, partial [Methylomirabilota bacterium]|nr:PAAR domain-containing protein [Methylomirabilota bacterium]